jgi:hypothetical protein
VKDDLNMPRGNVFELVDLPYEALENNVKPARMERGM